MPSLPPHPCATPGCPVLVHGPSLRCPVHRAQRDEEYRERQAVLARERTWSALYHHPQWREQRLVFLAVHPQCGGCGERATCVDHIRPHRGDPELFWNQSNWAPSCQACNARKCVLEEGGFGRQRKPQQ